MIVDSMARLAAANPVTTPPAIESPERLRCLIEEDAPQGDLEDAQRRHSRSRRRALAFAALAISASVAGVLLTAGSSGPGVNVAAAAYAATSPRSGIVEAVFVARIFRGNQAGVTLRKREWSDAVAGLRRELDAITEPQGYKVITHVNEWVFAPGRWENWSAGSEASVIKRVRIPGKRKGSVAFGGISLEGVEGIELYRQLYRRGWMRLVGRERHKAQLLWKLESRPLYYDANGKRVVVQAHVRLVVLVDPKTFLPVSERQIDIALPGHPTVVESDLVSYRHLAHGESEGKLFDLAAQHPGAQVVMGPALKFRPLHKSPRAQSRSSRLRPRTVPSASFGAHAAVVKHK